MDVVVEDMALSVLQKRFAINCSKVFMEESPQNSYNGFTPEDTMPKRDHGKDEELDKKIEALRRKNEALMKRYQEVEEDRKKAEEKGMAMQYRKGKADSLTITINKTVGDSRVVVTGLGGGESSNQKGCEDAGLEGESNTTRQMVSGRGRRRQLMVTMPGKKGKRVVSEKAESTVDNPEDLRPSVEDGQRKQGDLTRKQLPNAAQRDATPQESEVKQAKGDLFIPNSKEEQERYLRWKMERDAIDRERVARHKNAKGQWRREWDMDKTDTMFSDKSLPEKDRGPSGRGGRGSRRGHAKSNADSRGQEMQSRGKGGKKVPVVSSKAKGKDRLTGRARRWDDNEEEEHLKSSDTTLEEFLEELDALVDPEEGDHEDSSRIPKSPPGADAMAPQDVGGSRGGGSEITEESDGPGTSAQAAVAASSREDPPAVEASPPPAPEKKVRFSEELIQVAKAKPGAQSSPGSESIGPSSLKASKPSAQEIQVSGQAVENVEDKLSGANQDAGDLSAPVAQPQGSSMSGALSQEQQAFEATVDPETECRFRDGELPAAPHPPPAEEDQSSPQDNPVQPLEHPKTSMSSRNTEELIDTTSLSVLSLESGETHPAHTTSTDKARENGKIV